MYLTLIEENQLHKEELEEGLYPAVNFALGLSLVEKKLSTASGNEGVNTQHESPLIDDTSNFSANLIVNTGFKPLHISKGLLNYHIKDILQNKNTAESLLCNLFIVPDYTAQESDLAVKPLQTDFF